MLNLVITFIIIICCVCVISMADSIPAKEIKIYKNEIKDYWNNTEENKCYKYVENWYEVPKDNAVTFNLEDYQCIDMKCSARGFDQQKFVCQNSIIEIDRVITSGTWFCSMYANGTNQIIYFRLRVEGEIPPQHILVNQIILDAKTVNIEGVDNIYQAEYFYRDGEVVRIDCIHLDKRCTAQMTNPYSPTNNYTNHVWGTGFSLKLNSDYIDKNIQCISYCSGNRTIVKVKFVLHKEHGITDSTKIKINHQDVTRNMATDWDNTYKINYAYFLNQELVTITCDTNVTCEKCVKKGKTTDTEVTLIPNIISTVTCKVKKEDEGLVEVLINFELITSRNNSRLTLLNLKQHNILSESYVYQYYQGISLIYYTYQFEKDELFCFNCSVTPEVSSIQHSSYIRFIDFQSIEKETDAGKTHYSKYITLNLEDNNKELSCVLREFNKSIAQIIVLFSLKNQSIEVPYYDNHANQSDDNDRESRNKGPFDHSQFKSWIPAVFVPMLVVVVCVITVMYKMKKRYRLNLREPENTYDYCMTNTIISHHPVQSEFEYAVPEGEFRENTLYEHMKDSYAKVIPKSQRQFIKQQNIYAAPNCPKEFEESTGSGDLVSNSSSTSPDLIQDTESDPQETVDVNQGIFNKDTSHLEMLKDVYSEPINKIKTEETYTNVAGEPHYSNKIGGYCVYPTYSEPHIKD